VCECDADDHFWFALCEQSVAEVCESMIVFLGVWATMKSIDRTLARPPRGRDLKGRNFSQARQSCQTGFGPAHQPCSWPMMGG
jgi:hypothetical protein